MSYVQWPGEHEPCTYRGCRGKLVYVSIHRAELYDEGPQGGVRCENDHARWVWPRECEVLQSVLDAGRQHGE